MAESQIEHTELKYGSVIEADFDAARQWFSAIASAIGSKKRPVINECKIKSPAAWSLLKDYLNPYYTFHVGTKLIEANIDEVGVPFDNSHDLVSHFVNLRAASYKDIARLNATIGLFKDSDVSLFLKQYITKSLKIGITADTVNKSTGLPEIPVFGCMLAKKYFDNPDYIAGKNIVVTEKLDGIRAIAIVKPFLKKEPKNKDDIWDYSVQIFSRQGKRIEGLIDVELEIRAACQSAYYRSIITGDFVLDGELLITDKTIPSKEQYKQTVKIVNSDKERKTGIVYHVFDFIPADGFVHGGSDLSYDTRRNILETLLPSSQTYEAITVVPVLNRFYFNSTDNALHHVTKLVNYMRSAGKEGIMLNIADAPYVCKRTSDLLKVKVFQDCDLKIVGYQQGTGKFANTLGALIVDYKGNLVGVGSGISDDIRKEIWANQNQYIGRVVTVQYFEETCDVNGKLSIRFPVFKELREIGKEVSYE